MKDVTKKQLSELERLTKAEWVKTRGEPWPDGWTLKDFGKFVTREWQEDESEKAFSKVVDKMRGTSPSEIRKADRDPDWSFFWGIGSDSNRDLKIEWVKDRLQKAIAQNDLDFFIRLGDALKRKPRQLALDNPAFLLAAFWATPLGKIPPLSWFTDEALVEMLIILTGNQKLTFDQVRKARQRLGLKIKVVQIKGVMRVGSDGFKLLWVDKAKN